MNRDGGRRPPNRILLNRLGLPLPTQLPLQIYVVENSRSMNKRDSRLTKVSPNYDLLNKERRCEAM